MIDNMIVYVEKSQEISKIFLELISEFNKFAGYKIQNATVFLHNNKQSEDEIETIPLIASKRMKYGTT